jgi:ParB family transcriptional regulator, chromosome partitioning protein
MGAFTRRQQKSQTPIFTENEVALTDINLLTPYEFQPRICQDSAYDEGIVRLAEDIKVNGLINPVTVVRVLDDDHSTESRYYLVAGSRRVEAYRRLNRSQIPANIYVFKASDPSYRQKMFLLADSENEKRENLKPIESALALATMQNQFGMSLDEIASARGITTQSVRVYLRIAEHMDALTRALQKHGLTVYDVSSAWKLDEMVRHISNKDRVKLDALILSLIEPIPGKTEEFGKTAVKQKIRPKKTDRALGIFVDMKRPYRFTVDGKRASYPEYVTTMKLVSDILCGYGDRGAFTQFLADNPELIRQETYKMIDNLMLYHKHKGEDHRGKKE